MLDRNDLELVQLTSSASLDASPKKNWVENGGGLPPYVRKLARGIMKSGKSKSSAIAIAISRIKKWAAGGDGVDADTKAKAATALAQWEKLKAKKNKGRVVALSYADGTGYIQLSNISSFNTQAVRNAWEQLDSDARKIRREAYKAERSYNEEASYPDTYSYIQELWSDFIIVEFHQDGDRTLMKVPYEAQGENVFFGSPTEVKQEYVEVEEDLTPQEVSLLGPVVKLSADSSLSRIASLTKRG
jgi:hypothetical protein